MLITSHWPKRRIEPRRSGRPAKAPMRRVREMRSLGASVRQIRDALKLSHGTAQRAVAIVDAEIIDRMNSAV